MTSIAPIDFTACTDANPFRAKVAPFGPPLVDARERDDRTSDVGYALVKTAPDVDPSEVELPGTDSLEVMILWGTTVLHVAHLTPPRSFYVGEAEHAKLHNDFLVPAEVLGTGRAPVVLVDERGARVVVPRESRAMLRDAQGALADVTGPAAGEPCAELAGAREVALAAGVRATVHVGPLVIQVAAVAAGKPTRRGLAAAFDRTVVGYFGGTLFANAALVAALAYMVPPMGLTDDEGPDKDQIHYIQQMLAASAEKELERNEAADDRAASESEGGTGSRAAGEEGQTGKETSREQNRKWSHQGPKDNPKPEIPKETAYAQFVSESMIGLLGPAASGALAPTAVWGSNAAVGRDAQSFLGQMWGDDFGEAYGKNGLGLTGLGEASGGRGIGIGLGAIGTYGHGAGLQDGDGFGNDHGRLRGKGHVTRSPRVTPEGITSVSGRLPPETIQRTVRAQYGAFRFCYQKGLDANPNLAGRVTVRFTIDREGAVSTAANGGSDLPDSGVVSCIVRSFYGLSFAKPEGGIVTVVYPIALSPAG